MIAHGLRIRMFHLARRALPLAAGLSLLGLLAAVPASAATSSVLKTGPCSIHSTWKITMAHSDGRIEAAFEVDQNRNVAGVPWTVTLKHNGVTYFSGTKTTLADGSFEVSRLVPNLSGVDTISGVATRTATGEVCKGSASL